jgi:hypothetical protein
MPEQPPGARPIFDPDDPRTVIPGYAVRDDGAVLYWFPRRRRWVVLRRKVGPGGFQKVRVKIGDRVRELGVARLVCRAFHGPCPLGHEPLHYPDPDLRNNRADNLRWAPVGTSKLGRMLGPSPPPAPHGDHHPHARLTTADIPEIRRMARAGIPAQVIARGYDVDEGVIENVCAGRTWRHVPDPEGPGPIRLRRGPTSEASPLARLDWEAVRAIRAGKAAGRSYRELAREHGVNRCTIRDIVKGRTWKD